MPRAKVTNNRPRPGDNLKSRENRLILLAANLVEKRLIEGTASSQEVCQILKLGSSRERLEQERLRNENALSLAKKKSIEAEQHKDELYAEALEAFRSYTGSSDDSGEDDYDD